MESSQDVVRVDDPQIFSSLTEPYRRELQLHCYRMLGSVEDAEDLVQETFLRAWKRRATYQGRATLRAWLYKIATNACLDALKGRSRRSLPFAVSLENDPTQLPAPPVDERIWIEPYPTQQLMDLSSSPEARVALRESVRFAFLVALHGLPPRQRAVLILRDVLDWQVNEIAELLDTSVSAVNSVLHRARATLTRTYESAEPEQMGGPVADEAMRQLLGRYVQAWETSDVAALTALLRQDALLTMPPSPSWYRGPFAIGAIVGAMAFSGDSATRWRMLLTEANAQSAFAFYQLDKQRGVYQAFGLQVLSIEGNRITAIVAFVEPAIVERFGLSLELSQ